MKRAVKISLICIVVGVFLIIISGIIIHIRGRKVRDEFVRGMKNISSIVFSDKDAFEFAFDFDDSDNYNDNSHVVSSRDNVSAEKNISFQLLETNTYSFDEIDSIDVSIKQNCDFSILNTEDSFFSLEVYGEKMIMNHVSITNNKFVVNIPKQKNITIFGINFGDKKIKKIGRIVLYVPLGKSFDTVSIKAGIGNLHIENIACTDCTVSNGVGKCTIENTKMKEFNFDGGVGESTFNSVESDTSKIHIGVGETTMLNCSLHDVTIKGGVGAIHFDGRITGNSSIEIGLGGADITLHESKENYYLKYSTGLGSMTIDGVNSRSGTYNGKTAQHSLELEGGIGALTLRFND
ncbi:MAG: DUF4097 family beta strand repeat protein [Spirochaetaceae bacterium]|nr:DUF4097 family beta strand repeat protein [Spirochaetaceae bacterium]